MPVVFCPRTAITRPVINPPRARTHERERAWCVLCARACPARAASPCPKVRDAVPADHLSIACHCMFVFEVHKRVPNAKRLRW